MTHLVKGINMAALFHSPKAPDPITLPTPAAPPPTVDNAAVLRDQNDQIRRRRGRQAAILTGNSGAGMPDVQVNQLLGS